MHARPRDAAGRRLVGVRRTAAEDEDYGETLGDEHRAIEHRGNRVLTGCATIRGLQAHDTEQLLAAAGFTKQRAGAADPTLLDAAPPYRLVRRGGDGTGRGIEANRLLLVIALTLGLFGASRAVKPSAYRTGRADGEPACAPSLGYRLRGPTRPR